MYYYCINVGIRKFDFVFRTQSLSSHLTTVTTNSHILGKPKGVLHSTAGYMLYTATTFKHSFDHQPETDVYWCTADIGWITGRDGHFFRFVFKYLKFFFLEFKKALHEFNM